MHPLLVAGLTCVTSIFGIWYSKTRAYVKIANGDERAVADVHHMEHVLDLLAQAFKTSLTKFRHVNPYIGILCQRIMFAGRTSKPGRIPDALRVADSAAITSEWTRYVAACKGFLRAFERGGGARVARRGGQARGRFRVREGAAVAGHSSFDRDRFLPQRGSRP